MVVDYERVKVIKNTCKPVDAKELAIWEEEQEKNKQMLYELRNIADELTAQYKKWCYLREDYYKYLACHTIGIHIHSAFSTFPELFVNAMKGSGKTRLLNLIKVLGGGEMLLSLSETNLFRHPEHKLLVIDEVENIQGKEFDNIRQVLNSSYKKGGVVVRYRKVKTKDGSEGWEQERLPAYKPVVMANISGCENVVSDRANMIIVEKTDNPYYNKKQEDFEDEPELNELYIRLCEIQCRLCSLCSKRNIRKAWNLWVENQFGDTLPTLHTLPTLPTLPTLQHQNNHLEALEKEDFELMLFFEEINRTDIKGRDLELFFPIYVIAWLLGDDWLADVIETSKKMVEDKKVQDSVMSRDVMLYEFVATDKPHETDWRPLKELTQRFRQFALQDDNEDKWLNNMWMSAALKRLNLIKMQHRTANGVEVVLNIEKARDKLKMFKPKEEK